jgi:AraC-like DNA-binding protein
MDSLVPIIGHELLEKNSALIARVKYTIEEEFGHELRFVDAGKLLDLQRADPLLTSVPFAIAIKGVDPSLRADLLESLEQVFPSASLIEGEGELLPRLLKQHTNELSLGHLNGVPLEIRKAIRVIYKRMHQESLNVPLIAKDIGVSKSTLERVSYSAFSTGAGHVIARYRMEEAGRILVESKAPVNAISFAVGYSSLTSFDRAFSRYWGHSATDLRQIVKSVSQNGKQKIQIVNIMSQKGNKLGRTV